MPTAGGGGGVSISVGGQGDEKADGDLEKQWRESEDRAARLRGQWQGSRPWSGGQQDYEDALGPNRSGGMDKVVAKQPPKGPDPLGPVPDWGPAAGP